MPGLLEYEVSARFWHDARVVAIFKKGDTSLPANYRPISLLSAGYKLYASILLQRLKRRGPEQCIRRTQFGFKSGCGTTDALFAARRMIDAAWTSGDGELLLVMLDWSKALDRIHPAALLTALHRFGLPGAFIDMVRSIYSGRR